MLRWPPRLSERQSSRAITYDAGWQPAEKQSRWAITYHVDGSLLKGKAEGQSPVSPCKVVLPLLDGSLLIANLLRLVHACRAELGHLGLQRFSVVLLLA